MPGSIASVDEARPVISQPSHKFLRRHGLLIAGLSALFAVLVLLDIHTQLWFDELLTFYISKAGSLPQVWHLVRTWDLNPPTLHTLAHLSMRIFGPTEVGVRLPSVMAFFAASLLIYRYVDAKAGRAFGALAVLILWYNVKAFFYATDARPYALLCMWFSGLLVSWDLATRKKPRTGALWGVAISSAGLIATHVFGALSIFPFAVGELFRWARNRKPDYPLWAALLLPCAGMITYVPLYRNYKSIEYYPLAFQASFRKMGAFYWHAGAEVGSCVCVILVACLLAARWQRRNAERTAVRSTDVVVLAVAAANPVVLNLVLMPSHSAFWPRYCITSEIALYILFALFLAHFFRRARFAAIAANAVVLVFILVQRIAIPAYTFYTQGPVPQSATFLNATSSTLPIVASSGLTFVEMQQYEPPSVTSRLYYLKDRAAAIRYAHATIFEDLDRYQKAFHLGGVVAQYQPFVCRHPVFLVLGTGYYREDWLLKKLNDDGAQITVMGDYRTPYKDKTLYRISIDRDRDCPYARQGR